MAQEEEKNEAMQKDLEAEQIQILKELEQIDNKQMDTIPVPTSNSEVISISTDAIPIPPPMPNSEVIATLPPEIPQTEPPANISLPTIVV